MLGTEVKYFLAANSVSVTYSEGIEVIKPLSFVNSLVFVGISSLVAYPLKSTSPPLKEASAILLVTKVSVAYPLEDS